MPLRYVLCLAVSGSLLAPYVFVSSAAAQISARVETLARTTEMAPRRRRPDSVTGEVRPV